MKKAAFIFLALQLTVSATRAQVLTRGPYLQSSGPNSIIIRWRTDIASDSRVHYGLAQGAKDQTVDNAFPTTEHRVQLSGLLPHTKYYYSIGSATQMLRGDAYLYFTTAPDPAAPTPLRFWAMGDFGHGNEGQRLVRDSYLDFAAQDRPADLWIWMGDNAYQDGTDQEFQDKVFDSINGYQKIFMNLPFAATSGNHDYNSICPWQNAQGLPVLCNQDPNTHTGPYLDMIDPPQFGELGGVPSNRKIFYSFDYGDIHFISLNSELGSWNPNYDWIGIADSDTSFTSPMLEWLKADLAATTKKWKIAFWHQCPYSGQDNLTEENSVQQFCVATRHHFNPILERYGVDLVLTGHDHNFQRSYLINGHYYGKDSFTPQMMVSGTSGNDLLGEAYVKYTDGPLAGKGTVYVVAGGTSNVNDYSPIEHPAIYFGYACDTCLGSFIFDVDGDRLDAYYLTVYNGILDRFTIKKQSTTGVHDANTVLKNLEVYPNPAHSGQVTVSYALLKKSAVRIELLDLNQKVVSETDAGTLEPGNHEQSIDLKKGGFAKGQYLVRIHTNEGVSYRKLMIAD